MNAVVSVLVQVSWSSSWSWSWSFSSGFLSPVPAALLSSPAHTVPSPLPGEEEEHQDVLKKKKMSHHSGSVLLRQMVMPRREVILGCVLRTRRPAGIQQPSSLHLQHAWRSSVYDPIRLHSDLVSNDTRTSPEKASQIISFPSKNNPFLCVRRVESHSFGVLGPAPLKDAQPLPGDSLSSPRI